MALLVPQLIAERLASDTDLAMSVTPLDTEETGLPLDALLVQLSCPTDRQQQRTPG
ncbi:hypothetical protein [Kitasatospora sp. NPDC056800]|uniref:hypothetical protein n=1 Tax=Kitasatospora sp. NPDC056800 TaxID=3345948 RepID=UPI0036BBCF82